MKGKHAKKNLTVAFTQKAMEDHIKTVDNLAQQQRRNLKNLDRIYRRETRSSNRKYQRDLICSKQQLEKLKEKTKILTEARISENSYKRIDVTTRIHKDFAKSHKFIDKCYRKQDLAMIKRLKADTKILCRRVGKPISS